MESHHHYALALILLCVLTNAQTGSEICLPLVETDTHRPYPAISPPALLATQNLGSSEQAEIVAALIQLGEEKANLAQAVTTVSAKCIKKKTFICAYNQCNQICKSKAALQAHQRVHSGEKPFKCDVCKKSFSQKGNLTQHMNIHKQARPYKCSRCNKSFASHGNFTRHMHIHKGRIYTCSICGSGLSRKAHLERHMLSHSQNKSLASVFQKKKRRAPHVDDNQTVKGKLKKQKPIT